MKSKRLLSTVSIILLSFFTIHCTKDEIIESKKPEPNMSAADSLQLLDAAYLKRKSGQYIIISSTDSLPANLEQHVQGMKGKVTTKINKIGIATATSSDPSFASKCGKLAGIKKVIKDYTVQWRDPSKIKRKSVYDGMKRFGNPPSSGEDDALFDLQWGHDAINAPEAWEEGYRGAGAKVAILDSGFDLDHPDLAANIDFSCSANFVPNETLQFVANEANTFSHGSYVAGIVAGADNGVGIIGVAPKARLMLVKVVDDAGDGSFSWLLQGIVHAVNNGADVINMSLGAPLFLNGMYIDDNGTPDNPDDDSIKYDPEGTKNLIDALNKATAYANQKGVTLISATGNEQIDIDPEENLIILPAQASHVLGISATAPRGWGQDPSTDLDLFASYSNTGFKLVDFAAPGGNLSSSVTGNCSVAGFTLSCDLFDMIISADQDGYTLAAGTSSASPYASGVAAIIIGKHKGRIKPAEVAAIMKGAADDLGETGKDAYYGDGRLNAFRAVVPRTEEIAATSR